MTNEKAGGLALLVAVLSGVAVMALHPTHGDLPPLWASFTLNQVVHGLAIVATPVLVFGAVQLSRWLGLERPLAVLGLSFYALGSVFIMLAAAMSGFVQSSIAEAAHDPDMAGLPLHAMGDLTWFLNQAFSHTYTALASLAIVCWSLAWRGKGMKVFGVIVSVGILAWQLSGTLSLNIHGMGAVVILQGLWLLLAGAALWRAKP